MHSSLRYSSFIPIDYLHSGVNHVEFWSLFLCITSFSYLLLSCNQFLTLIITVVSTSVPNRFTISTLFYSAVKLKTPENKGFVKDRRWFSTWKNTLGEKAMIFKACNFCLSCWSLWNPFVSHTVFSYSLDSCNLKGKVITSVPMLARALMISRHRCECHLNSTTNS